jgi:signal transduction histidine kinase
MAERENIFQRIIHQGATPHAFDFKNRRIIYANIIYLSLPVVYIAFVLIDYKTYLQPSKLAWDQFIFLVEILICAVGIYLNRKGHFNTSRFLFLITWPFLLHLIPIWHQQTPSDYFFAFPVGIIFHSILIQLMISARNEKVLFAVAIVINFAFLIFSIDLLVLFQFNTPQPILDMVQESMYLMDAILYWLLFSLVTFLLIYIIELLLEKVQQSQLTIEEQQKELLAVNEELRGTNENLVTLNDTIANWNESLEKTIVQRTREVEAQNLKLKDIAFFNAHKLRAPYCRIKGLLALLELIIDEEEKTKIKNLLMISLNEFDSVVQEIQNIYTEKF